MKPTETADPQQRPAPPDRQSGVMDATGVLRELSDIAAAWPGTDDVPVKMADKLKALELLGKHYALFTDSHALEGMRAVIEIEDYGDDG